LQIDDETLAKLILSVGTHKKLRPLPPITAAKEIEELCKRSSVKEVAKQLSVTTRTISMFRNLLTLPETIQKLIEEGKIGRDVGDRISRFPDPKDQIILAKALMDRKVTAEEIKSSIKNFRNIKPEMPISECIELAIKYRPIIEEEHLVISKIRASTLNGLKKRSKAQDISLDDLACEILNEHLPTEKGIISARIFDRTLVVAMKNEGFKAFKAESVKSKVRLNDLIDRLIDRGFAESD